MAKSNLRGGGDLKTKSLKSSKFPNYPITKLLTPKFSSVSRASVVDLSFPIPAIAIEPAPDSD
jgi:hypothetical protein